MIKKVAYHNKKA